MLGLVALTLIRAAAVWVGVVPGAMFGAHFIAVATDTVNLLYLPAFLSRQLASRCLQGRCAGITLSLTFGMCVADIGALLMYLYVATPSYLSSKRKPLIDVVEASIGVWDFAIVASVSLQLVLCTCSWQIYKILRRSGLLRTAASGSNGHAEDDDISFMAFLCEAEDVELWHECEFGLSSGTKAGEALRA